MPASSMDCTTGFAGAQVAVVAEEVVGHAAMVAAMREWGAPTPESAHDRQPRAGAPWIIRPVCGNRPRKDHA
jgi:hypothetical protein